MAKNYKDYAYFENRPDVVKIFDDLETWHDYCRFNMIDFNPADLYRSQAYKDYTRRKNGYRTGYQGKNPRPNFNGERKPYQGNKPRFENKTNGERFSR
jgi:hypothetical protein